MNYLWTSVFCLSRFPPNMTPQMNRSGSKRLSMDSSSGLSPWRSSWRRGGQRGWRRGRRPGEGQERGFAKECSKCEQKMLRWFFFIMKFLHNVSKVNLPPMAVNVKRSFFQDSSGFLRIIFLDANTFLINIFYRFVFHKLVTAPHHIFTGYIIVNICLSLSQWHSYIKVSIKI